MSVKSVKRIAASMLKSGVSRIRVTSAKDAEEALTREDVRGLIKSGSVTRVQKKGSSRKYSSKLLEQKRKGRRSGQGKRRGKYGARTPKKREWIKGVRAMRRLMKELRDNGQIEGRTYTTFYRRVKGGEFRNKKHVLLYLKDHGLLKKKEIQKKPKGMKKEKKPDTEPKAKTQTKAKKGDKR